MTDTLPPSAATRSAMPARPEPADGTAPPTPSSRTARRGCRCGASRRSPRSRRGRAWRRSPAPRWPRSTRRSRPGPRSARRSRPRASAAASAPASSRRAWPRPSSSPAGRTPRASSRSSSIAPETSATTASSGGAGPGSLVLQVAQGEADRDEPLLRAVVDVALEPAALLVAGGDDAGARRLDLGQLAAHLDAQARDLDRQPGRADRAVERVGPLGQRRIVDDGREREAAAAHRRPHPAGRIGAREHPARRVDLDVALEAEAQLERRDRRAPPRASRRCASGAARPARSSSRKRCDGLQARVAGAVEAAVDEQLHAAPAAARRGGRRRASPPPWPASSRSRRRRRPRARSPRTRPPARRSARRRPACG